MDPKFQTSFIPKKQSAPSFGGVGMPHPAGRTTSVFMILAILIFVISVGALGGVYAWKMYLTSSQVSYKKQLADREAQFDIKTIEMLKAANFQIDTARQLIKKHVAMSQVFDMIGQLTISSVRFGTMDLGKAGGENGDITLTMKGQGVNLAAVAWQSDVLAQLEQRGLAAKVKNPIVSDPVLDSNGSVSFGFSAKIDPSALSYESLIKGDETAVPATP